VAEAEVVGVALAEAVAEADALVDGDGDGAIPSAVSIAVLMSA
jgi:hypothetical protein